MDRCSCPEGMKVVEKIRNETFVSDSNIRFYAVNPLSVSYFWYRNPSVYSLCPRMDRSSLPLRKRQRQEDNSLRNRSISQDLYPSVCSEEQSLANKHEQP